MREQRKLIYKDAAGAGTGTLQSALTAALARFPKVPSRLQKLGTDNSRVQFINLTRLSQGMLIGVFHKLTPGAAQQVIEMGEEKPEWPVALVPAKSAEKPNREFISGSLYFGIWKNHVILHQSVACRASHFQEHLSWLLSRQKPGAEKGATAPQLLISLGDPINEKVRKNPKTHAKRVVLGSSLKSGPAQPPSKATSTKAKFTLKGGLWQAIKSILIEVKGEVPAFLLDDQLGEDDIHGALELWCSKRKAETTAGEVLAGLGRALSDSNADYTVVLADGTKIERTEMKVEDYFSVECVQRQPVAESLFGSMVDYLKRLIDNQTVIEKESFGNL